MRNRETTKAIRILICLTVIAITFLVFCWRFVNGEVLFFSHESGIYDQSFVLKVDAVKRGDIYYTVDGTAPDITNKSAILYEKPVSIELTNERRAYSLQFKCYYDDGKESPIYIKEFVLDQEGPERFGTKYIVSVTGNEDAIWGYEQGIFVRGRQFDKYMEANPDVDLTNVMIPANYYSEEEVPVHVTIFDKKGQELVSKNCGLKIYGNWTRAKNQKSFRLYARDIYDGENEFRYEFLSKLVSDENNSIIDEYQRLSFHNSGNDNGYGFVRTALIGELARQFHYEDVLVSESAVVYVNGRYQGLYWLQNTFDDKYFKEKYGLYTGEMVVCEGKLDSVEESKQEAFFEEAKCLEEYNEFCEWVKTNDMNDDSNWERVCRTIDVKNFVKYMAIQYYIGNKDWPYNNVKVYRYVASDGYEEGSVFDGRYRYILFDTDYGMGLKFLGWFGLDEYSKRLQELCNRDGSAGIFASMMQRKEFEELFVNTVLVLSQGVFKEGNVQAALGDYCQTKDGEIRYMFEKTDLMKNSLWESDDNCFANVEFEHAKILAYSRNRPELVRNEIQEVLDSGMPMEMSVSSEVEGKLYINGIESQNSYEGYCFENIPMTISYVLPMGSEVVGYYVNDEYVSGNVLELSPKQWFGKTQKIEIYPDTKSEPTEQLSVIAYDIDGEQDYIVLGNVGNVELLLSDYSISDSLETAKGRLPEVVLNPGEECRVYGKHYSGDIVGGIKVSFSWSDDEKIVLSNKKKGIIEQR